MRSSLPAAADVFRALPPPRTDGASLRAAIRDLRTADGLLLGVLDDDPTGSQSVHGVGVVTVFEEDAYEAALAGPAATCFVLTNTRSLGEAGAVALNTRTARGLQAVAARRGARLQLISRSDSTLRGHVMAEVAALQAARRTADGGRGFDGVLLVPAFLEAGRLTAADIHWARTGGRLIPAGETEYARDATFGYQTSDLRDFITEKSHGAVSPADVRSIGLADIRPGGPPRVAELLAGLRDGAWAVVNATDYADLEAVACGVLLAEREGRSFLFRSGPSFVRALSGLEPQPPLRGADLTAGRTGYGLIVAGSHVSTTSRQLDALRTGGRTIGIELPVPAIVNGDDGVAAAAGRRAAAALASSDVLLCTSRTLVTGGSREESLAIARRVSAALSAAVAEALAGEPAWVVAKGGITSHDVATRGLGIRRAEVAGQLFPGVISVLRPVDAAAGAIGMPYVVFPGNVGDDQALRQVVAILHGEEES